MHHQFSSLPEVSQGQHGSDLAQVVALSTVGALLEAPRTHEQTLGPRSPALLHVTLQELQRWGRNSDFTWSMQGNGKK